MTIEELLSINTTTPVLDTAIVYAFMENKPAPAYDPFTDSSYTQLTDTELYELTFYVYDHLGNTRVTYEPKFENGIIEYAIKGVFDYYPYGKTLRFYNPEEEKYLTTQHQRDTETGFDYRGARFYDADVARFLSVDPLAVEFPNESVYFYVGGNPVTFIDPDGREKARPEEIKYAAANPIDASYVLANKDVAFEKAQNSKLPNARDGQQDAFRHALWNALNARDIGAKNAEPFATLHENGSNPANDPNSSSYDPVAIEMDLFNNQVGRNIGESNPDATDDEIATKVLEALNSGELKIIAMDASGNYLDKDGNVTKDNKEKVITTVLPIPFIAPAGPIVKASIKSY